MEQWIASHDIIVRLVPLQQFQTQKNLKFRMVRYCWAFKMQVWNIVVAESAFAKLCENKFRNVRMQLSYE